MLTWECLVDTVRDDLPFILSVSTGCAISASCLEKRKHFYLRVALTICWRSAGCMAPARMWG